MKNKINKILDKVNFIIIILLIALVPITFFINYFSMFHFQSDFTFKIYQFLVFILPIEILIYFYKLFTKEFRMNIFDLLIYLLLLFGLISTVFALDVELAMWGSVYRFEGFIQICCYYFLFLNSRFITRKDLIVKIINTLIIVGILQAIYSFLQVFVRGDYIYVKYEIVKYRSSGFIGHPNMLGSYIVLTLMLCLGMYFLYGKHKKFYLISSILLYINLILAESTGPFYGFLVALIFMFIYLFKEKKINLKHIVVTSGLCLILLYGVTFISEKWCENRFNDRFTNDFTITGDIKTTFTTFRDIITKNVKENNFGVSDIESYGNNRIWLWTRSINLIPKYWLHGTGIDCFGIAFNDSLSEEDKSISYLGGAYFDRAHNEYLHLVITQGLLTLITYLTFVFLVFIYGLKSKDTLVWILMFGFVGYAVQAFTNISVYNVAPFFFITMGLLIGLEQKNNIIE